MKYLRGSKPGGEKVFSALDENSDGVVDKDERNLNLHKVFQLFDRYLENEFVEDRISHYKNKSTKDEL